MAGSPTPAPGSRRHRYRHRSRARRRILAGGAALLLGATVGILGLVACSSSDDSSSAPGKTTPGKDATTSSPDATGTITPSPGVDAAPPPSASDAGDAGGSGRDLGTDASTFFGASRCSASGLLFCDGFEQPVLDGGDWSQSVYGNGTTITVDTSQAARGKSSIHVVLNGNGASELVLKKIFPISGDRYFGRVFTRFHQLPRPPMPYAHWTFAAATGTGAVGETRLSAQLETRGQTLENIFGVGTDTGDSGTRDWTTSDDDPDGSPRAVPTDAWLCIEWMNDGTADQTRFWWDGVEHPSLATSATVHGGNQDASYELPDYTQAWIGFAEYQDAGSQPFEAWYDEIAYDTQRIGCTL